MSCIAQLHSDCEDCYVLSFDDVWYNATDIFEEPVASVPNGAGIRQCSLNLW
jgi:hypothetical protein